MKVLVTGGRHYADRARVFAELDAVLEEADFIECIMHGGCTGADSIAADWANRRHVAVRQYFADWTRLGRRAGPIRNQQMIDEKPGLVLAFPGASGTADCVRRAKAAGLKVRQIR